MEEHVSLKQRLSLEVTLGVLLRVEGSIGGKRKRRGRGLGSADPHAQRFAQSSQGHLWLGFHILIKVPVSLSKCSLPSKDPLPPGLVAITFPTTNNSVGFRQFVSMWAA